MATQELQTGTDEDVGSGTATESGESIVDGSDDTMVSPELKQGIIEAVARDTVANNPGAKKDDLVGWSLGAIASLLGAALLLKKNKD